jgi:hypothetical protein
VLLLAIVEEEQEASKQASKKKHHVRSTDHSVGFYHMAGENVVMMSHASESH